jgi:hypothetical protein
MEQHEGLYNQMNIYTPLESSRLICSGELQRRQDELFNAENGVANSKEQIHFMIEVARHISNICLDNTIDIITSLKMMGFKDKELCWVIPYKEQIEPEILKINNKKEYHIIEENLIIILRYYLSTKIYIMVINHYRIIDKKAKIPLDFDRVREGFTNIKKKTDARKNAINPEKLTDFDIAMGKIKNLLDPILPHISNKTTMEKYVPSLSTRNFDKILVPIFKDSTTVTGEKEKTKNHKYRTFYHLFRLMMPQRQWAANDIDFSKHDEGDGYDFEEYKTKKMLKFFAEKK